MLMSLNLVLFSAYLDFISSRKFNEGALMNLECEINNWIEWKRAQTILRLIIVVKNKLTG